MHRPSINIKKAVLIVMGSILCLSSMVGTSSAATTTDSTSQKTATSTTTPPPAPNETSGYNCPAGLPAGTHCTVVVAGLANDGCNWSWANRPTDLPVYGINEHTTEGTLQSALNEAQNTSNCVSWNYLIDQQGNVYVSVPRDSLAYDVDNWWENTHNIEVEHVGYSEDCSTLTNAEMQSSEALDRWLIQKYHIDPTAAMITGHQSVPGVDDGSQATQHWDPGYCWPWAQYLAAIGAPIVPTATPKSSVVTVRTDDSHQPIQNCPGTNFTDCTDAPSSLTDATNFVAMYTGPSTSDPLVSDPYLHPDSSAGSTAEQDWGDKAVTGHDYVVISRQPGWTEVWFNGQKAWFQDNGQVTVPTAAYTVTPKTSASVALYGRPLPDYDNPAWNNISYDPNHTQPVPLSDYAMLSGQQYAIVAAPSVSSGTQPKGRLELPGVPPLQTDYAEGCNTDNCTGPGDGTVVVDGPDETQYIEISYGARYAFVQLNDVNVELNGVPIHFKTEPSTDIENSDIENAPLMTTPSCNGTTRVVGSAAEGRFVCASS